MKIGINEDSIRYSFLSSPKIRAFERHLPQLLSEALTAEQVERFFRIIRQLPPIFVRGQLHKLWNVMQQTGTTTDVQLQAISEIQYYLRRHEKFFPTGLAQEELNTWGDRESQLFSSHYQTTATS